MTQIDQFASVFKSAVHEVFAYERIAIAKVLVVSDLQDEPAATFGARARTFLAGLGVEVVWRDLGATDFSNVGELLEQVVAEAPDLLCTYRHLNSSAWRWPHSLGSQLDVLTQATPIPVLVLPRPEKAATTATAPQKVMALTDHLTGDARLVNYAAAFTAAGGTLVLAHIEDERIFDRYMEVIAKISSLDTDTARQTIRDRLIKEPEDYIRSCQEGLAAHGLPLTLHHEVSFGHRLSEIERLVREHRLDLLVLNTKDADQLAMHGLAYAVAVQLRHTPLLML